MDETEPAAVNLLGRFRAMPAPDTVPQLAALLSPVLRAPPADTISDTTAVFSAVEVWAHAIGGAADGEHENVLHLPSDSVRQAIHTMANIHSDWWDHPGASGSFLFAADETTELAAVWWWNERLAQHVHFITESMNVPYGWEAQPRFFDETYPQIPAFDAPDGEELAWLDEVCWPAAVEGIAEMFGPRRLSVHAHAGHLIDLLRSGASPDRVVESLTRILS